MESVTGRGLGSGKEGRTIHLTENQLKVIRDKYLKDAKSPEAWLRNVARNIALAELLYVPECREEIFRGVKHHIVSQDAGDGSEVELIRLHHEMHAYREREANFKRFMANLYALADRDPGAAKLVDEAEERFYRRMADFEFLPNSPTLMNAGRELQQLSACYVLPVPDSIEGIFGAVKNQALIHKSGGGTGFSFGRIRPADDQVQSTMGIASGPISFMKIFDAATEQVKQGGTRRGANMAILPYWHPNIVDFITMKRKRGNTTLENFNISVGIDAAFIDAVKKSGEISLRNPRTDEVVRTMPARELFDLMVECAWECGDPGYVVLDRINNSGSNPTPALGQIEATNPCFRGDMRLATDKGLLTFEELHTAGTEIAVATDDRVPGLRAMEGLDGVSIVREPETGVTLRPAVPVFRTKRNHPVFRLVTKHGFEVVATADHKFYTPFGRRELKDLKPGDPLLIQSGAGVWNKDHRLAAFEATDKFGARVERGEAKPPTRWSRELGELLGWVVADGWVSAETPSGRTVPNYTVGLSFGKGEEERVIAEKFRALIREWTGLEGSCFDRPTGLYLQYKSALYYFLRSLGLTQKQSLEKEVPEAIWRAPREAVLGFLSALFTADGTVAIGGHRCTCTVRLAGSSRALLQQVQLLLLNEGIVAGLYHRRKAGEKLLPDARREPRAYKCADQYELIIDKSNRDRFLSEIGFMVRGKQEKGSNWVASMKRESGDEDFLDRVATIAPEGLADVYCTTEPATHSVIVNGLPAAQCGEQPLLPNEPCNLGSINLYKFVTGHNGSSSIDWERLRETVFDCIHFLDNVIDLNDYPVPEIEEMAKGNRRIGLGVMGWAETLVALHVPYDSEQAIEKAEEVMSFINKAALEASIRLAEERGVFPNWKDSIYDAEGKHFRGEHVRPRNCARTTIAPTGTIAIAAGLQGSGIEPFFAIAYTRYNARGLDALKAGREPAPEDTFFEVNPQFRDVAEANGYFGLSEADLWKKVNANHKSARAIPEIPKDVQDLFSTAHDVSFERHIAAQAAFQKYTDNAVSKTINCPNETTKEEIGRAYMLGYDLGVKGLTVYRDGSKTHQVLNLTAGGEKQAAPAPSRRPSSEHGVTSEYYEKMTGYGPLHVNIVYDQHGPFRVFANIPPLGTEIAGLTAVIGILLSKYLETGGKAEKILKHLNSVKGDKPIGFGPNRVESIPHALSQILREHLKKHGHLTLNGNGNGAVTANPEPRAAQIGESATCPKCYSTNVEFVSGCKEPTCFDCGYSNCS